MSSDDLENFEAERELQLAQEYQDVAAMFRFAVETERRFYLANDVKVTVTGDAARPVIEVELTDAWVWDMYRKSRFVPKVQGADVQGRQRRGTAAGRPERSSARACRSLASARGRWGEDQADALVRAHGYDDPRPKLAMRRPASSISWSRSVDGGVRRGQGPRHRLLRGCRRRRSTIASNGVCASWLRAGSRPTPNVMVRARFDVVSITGITCRGADRRRSDGVARTCTSPRTNSAQAIRATTAKMLRPTNT